jgi:hypothetical protein
MCAHCLRDDNWHAVNCPAARFPSLGMGTVQRPRADEPDDELQDCAPEGCAMLDHPQEMTA